MPAKSTSRRSGPLPKWAIGPVRVPHPARLYAIAMMCAYLPGGIYGLVLDPYLHNIKLFRTFTVNGPHSVFHIAIGAIAALAIATRRDFTYARLMTFVFAVLSVMGYLQQPVWGLLYLGGADIFLHGFTAILGDAVARLEEREITEEEIEVLEEEVADLEAGR